MKKAHSLIFVFHFLISTTCFAQKKIEYTANENSYISLFNDFTNHIIDCIQKKTDIGDTIQMKYILVHYLFIGSKLDTMDETHINVNKLKSGQLNSVKKELYTFYRFFQERENQKLAENLTAIPIRSSSDTFIYNRLTSFQRENTLIFYDKRFPKQTLGYMLFMPPVKNIISTTKIWSWSLVFEFGKFMFKSVTGEEGYEYMLSPEKFRR